MRSLARLAPALYGSPDNRRGGRSQGREAPRQLRRSAREGWLERLEKGPYVVYVLIKHALHAIWNLELCIDFHHRERGLGFGICCPGPALNPDPAMRWGRSGIACKPGKNCPQHYQLKFNAEFSVSSLNLEEGLSLNACFRLPASFDNLMLVPIMVTDPETSAQAKRLYPTKASIAPVRSSQNSTKKRFFSRRRVGDR